MKSTTGKSKTRGFATYTTDDGKITQKNVDTKRKQTNGPLPGYLKPLFPITQLPRQN